MIKKNERLEVLYDLKKGEKGIVVDYNCKKEDLQKIAKLGIIKGVGVKVLQKYPSFQFGVFNTRFVVDRELAKKILVRKVPKK